jgi:hypothetical protein
VDPEALKAALRLALLIFIAAIAMLPLQRAGSAEQVVTVLAAIVGALFVGAVILVARLSGARTPPEVPSGRERRERR